ncbi:MAG: hypothetical protein U0N59_04680, partial [Oscillospiraceae bacterium]
VPSLYIPTKIGFGFTIFKISSKKLQQIFVNASTHAVYAVFLRCFSSGTSARYPPYRHVPPSEI